MKIIFEAMKRIEATRIVEFTNDELRLVIEALVESGCYDCDRIAQRLRQQYNLAADDAVNEVLREHGILAINTINGETDDDGDAMGRMMGENT